MSTLGLIVEYNPFHNGHKYHLQQAKKITSANTAIAVMSGSFLQRGEPALIDKWTRAEMALQQGIDLVVELPTVYATQSADLFAYGATYILHHLKVDSLVFGSETNSIEALNTVADLILDEPPLLKKYIKNNLAKGVSYPKALSISLNMYCNNDKFNAFKPNDILGIQYLYNLKLLNSSIKASTLKRKTADYHDQKITATNIASATAIRNHILTYNNLDTIHDVVPESTYSLLNYQFSQNRINNWNNYFKTLQILINRYSNIDLENIHGMNEGLENRIKQNINKASSYDDFIDLIKTKRYTNPKIQRTLLNLMLNLTKTTFQSLEINKGPKYIRILGFNENGKAYLNKLKHDIQLPIITKIPREKSLMLEFDINSSKIYELGLETPSPLDEYKRTPIYLK